MTGNLTVTLFLISICSMTLIACGGVDEKPVVKQEASVLTPVNKSVSSSNTAVSSDSTSKVIKVVNKDAGGSGKYQFSPAKFQFKLGETVTFEIVGETEFHTFTVEDLKIDESVNIGEKTRFTHKFDKLGNFKLICIPHNAMGMVGEIVVK